MSYAFSALPHEALLQLQSDLQETAAGATVNIFFNRSIAV